jgi:hypothetical protein
MEHNGAQAEVRLGRSWLNYGDSAGCGEQPDRAALLLEDRGIDGYQARTRRRINVLRAKRDQFGPDDRRRIPYEQEIARCWRIYEVRNHECRRPIGRMPSPRPGTSVKPAPYSAVGAVLLLPADFEESPRSGGEDLVSWLAQLCNAPLFVCDRGQAPIMRIGVDCSNEYQILAEVSKGSLLARCVIRCIASSGGPIGDGIDLRQFAVPVFTSSTY